MLATAVETYSTREAVDLAGVTYRQADYWIRRGLVEPHVNPLGSGTRRRWTIEDILALRVVHLLMVHRVPFETIHEVLGGLHSSKPLVWIRGRSASVGDAFDLLAEADHLTADEMVLVFSPAAMLREILDNRG
jgi:DNA-binding transcriptional MerR regulator